MTALKAKGMPVGSVAAAVAWHKKNIKPSKRRTTGVAAMLESIPSEGVDETPLPQQLLVAQVRKAKAHADVAELERDQAFGRVAVRADLEREFTKSIDAVKRALLAVPRSIAMELNPSNPSLAESIVDRAIRDAITGALRG